MKLEEHYKLQLVGVPGHIDTDRNETADEMARQGTSHPLKVPGYQAGYQGLDK
jgi:ribonuclease HI